MTRTQRALLATLLLTLLATGASMASGPPNTAHAAGLSLASEPESEIPKPEYMRALVVEVGPTVEEDIGYGMIIRTQRVKLQVTSGQRRGLTFEVDHANPNDPAYEILVESGRTMLISAVFDGSEATDVTIEDYARDGYLVWLGAAFAAVLILVGSGMNVGRDVMGTMSNTLILAYTGGAVPLLLLFMAYQLPMVRLTNLDLVATEIVRALTGSIGLVLAIPITAAASSFLVATQPQVDKLRDTGKTASQDV